MMEDITQEWWRMKKDREGNPPANQQQKYLWRMLFAEAVVRHNKVPESCQFCMFYGPFTDLCWLSQEDDKWTCEVTDFTKYLLENI